MYRRCVLLDRIFFYIATSSRAVGGSVTGDAEEAPYPHTCEFPEISRIKANHSFSFCQTVEGRGADAVKFMFVCMQLSWSIWPNSLRIACPLAAHSNLPPCGVCTTTSEFIYDQVLPCIKLRHALEEPWNVDEFWSIKTSHSAIE